MIVIGVPLIVGSPWIFLYFSPDSRQHGKVRLYNVATLLLAAAVCAAIFIGAQAGMADTEEAEWWPLVALVYCAIAVPLVLLVAGLIRNFMLFRDRE